MEFISRINSTINGFVWGPYMLALLVGTGIFITFATKFFQITKANVWIKSTFGSLGKKEKTDENVTPFQAVTTALASTVGTGNIAGIATAIVLGGPGAVFWMWFSAFFGMMTKYGEVVLAIHFREKDEKGIHYGGPMYYIEKGTKLKWLAVLFAAFGGLASFGIGSMTQVNSIAAVVNSNFAIPQLATGIVIAVATGLVIIGGIKRIASFTEKLVPLMAILYIVSAVIVLIINSSKIPNAFSVIFENAFSFTSVGGGIMGYVIARGMRYGIARGVFSNEAGLGSAPIAHAASNTNNPVRQGLWGIFEVFVDTIVICTLTALVVLTSGLYVDGQISGSALTSKAFSNAIGQAGGYLLAISLTFFAFSTIIGWSYYGERCFGYLTKNNKNVIVTYKLIYVISIVLGSTLNLVLVWDIADTLNGLMAIPNLIGVLALSGTIFTLTKKYLIDPDSVNMKD